MGKVLDFRSYHMLNEEDSQTTKKSALAAVQILNLFFSAYTNLVTKIGNYTEAQKDLLKVAESDAENMGKAMGEVLKKIASKVDPKYAEPAKAIAEAGDKISDVYSRVMETEEGKNSGKEVKDQIYRKIINFIKTLKAEVAQSPKPVEKTNESVNSELFLFEKNIFKDEREKMTKSINPIITYLETLSKNSPTQELRSKAAELYNRLEEIKTKISQENDEEWSNLKKRERVAEINKLTEEIGKIKEDLDKELVNVLSKIGLDNEISEKIKEVNKIVSDAIKQLQKKDEEIIAKEVGDGGNKSEDDKSGDVEEGEYEDIESGNSDITNLRKSGKNFKKIMSAQEKMNLLLPDADKIKPDGLYGNRTEIAIKKIANKFKDIAPEFLKDLDGKTMTAGFQKFLTKYSENKDKIKELFK